MPLQPMEEWVVFLIMGSVLPGYMFRYQYCLVGGMEPIVLGSIRWCVWSVRPSSPWRLPHLKCLLCYVMLCYCIVSTRDRQDRVSRVAAARCLSACSRCIGTVKRKVSALIHSCLPMLRRQHRSPEHSSGMQACPFPKRKSLIIHPAH